MSFMIELNSPARTPIGTGDYGFPIANVQIISPDGHPAVDPVLISPEPKDVGYEPGFGADQKIHDRKRQAISLDIDWIDGDTKQAIDELMWNGRDVYICANYNARTMFSFPFFRDDTDLMGNETLTLTRSATAYEWDPVDRVMRKWDSATLRHGFHGLYPRHLVTGLGYTNRATKPHPDNTTTGWTNVTGTTNISYTEEVLSPVLSQRGVANQQGVTHINAVRGTIGGAAVKHTASSITTTDDLCASLVIRCAGEVEIRLRDSAGTTSETKTYAAGTLEDWTLVELSGANGSSGTTADILIIFKDGQPATLDRSQNAYIGPVMISHKGTTGRPPVFAWHTGTALIDTLQGTSKDRFCSAITISFVTRYKPWELGWMRANAAASPYLAVWKNDDGHATFPDAFRVDWNNAGTADSRAFADIATEYGLSDGDDMHVVVRLSPSQVDLFINGVAHSSNGNDADLPQKWPNAMNMGYSTNERALDGSYLALMRADGYAWTDAEIQNHYHTYGDPYGAQTISRLVGRLFTIDNAQWRLRSVSSGVHQWIGRLDLRELSIESWAPIQRQENL